MLITLIALIIIVLLLIGASIPLLIVETLIWGIIALVVAAFVVGVCSLYDLLTWPFRKIIKTMRTEKKI